MSFESFLKVNVAEAEEVEVEISERFKDPFVVKCLGTERVKALEDESRKKIQKGKNKFEYGEIDSRVLLEKIIVESIVIPDLKNEEIQRSWGTIGDPIKTLDRMTNYGEYQEIAKQITIVNGLADDEELQKAIEEAKN